jgi:hypothetical protein
MAKKNRQAKDMELAAADEAMDKAPEEKAEPKAAPKVHFDGWWSLRKDAIPAIHKKEIIKADFSARKVPAMATMAEYDEALKKYGVVLA